MIHLAKFKLVIAIVVAASVVISDDIQTRQVIADDASKPPETTEQSEPARPVQVWGEEKAGLACSISTKKTTFQPGEPIPVRFDLKNVSDKPQTVWHCGFWPNHHWVVQDAAGRDLKLTDRGRQCRDRYDDPSRDKNFPVVVQPEKLDAAYYGPYDLRRHFEIPGGATIHVQCVYARNTGGRQVEVASNTLTLTVEQPSFTFSTGGRYHFEGFGEWIVTLTNTGVMSVTHWVRDTKKQYGPYTLNERELADLKALVQRADSSGLESSTRAVGPDSVKWTVSFKRKDEATTYRIWEQDARKKTELRQLAARLGTLVRAYTKQQPVGFPKAEKGS